MMVARTWFGCSVSEMLARVDAQELHEIEAEYLISPWDETRAESQRAAIGADLVNVWSGKGRGRKSEDYVFKSNYRPRKSSSAIMAHVRNAVRAFQGK